VAVFQFEPLSPTHSFNATIMVRGLPTAFETKEEFLEFINAKLREDSPRFERQSFESTLTELHGQWAVSYRTRYLDKSPANSPSPLVMTIAGILYMHPYMKEHVIDAFYSERGEEEELDGGLDAVGDAIIYGAIPEAW